MHEMSLVESMLQIIEEAAHQQGCTRVSRVKLEIGQLACVEKEALYFCFDAVMRGSVADRAQLEIIEIAGQGRCRKCAQHFPLAALYQACPACDSYDVEVLGGDGMRVMELEVE